MTQSEPLEIYAVGKPKAMAEPDSMDAEEWELTQQSWVPAKACTELVAGVPVGAANVMVDAAADARTEQLAASLRDPSASVFADEDDRPLTAEEIAEAKQEWAEAKARVAEMASSAPSFAATNGEESAGPSVKRRDKRSEPQAPGEGEGRHGDARQPSCAGVNGSSGHPVGV